MRPQNRQMIIGLAAIPAVVAPMFSGYAAAGVGLGVALGLAAVVLLAVLDDVVLDADARRVGAGLEDDLGERAEMSTKQLIATGGGTVASVGIVGLIKQDVIGGITYAVTYGIVGFINGLFDKIGMPLWALVTGIADIIESSLTGFLLDAGFRVAARDLQSYGIVAPLVAAVITFGVAAILYVAMRRMDYSPLQLVYDRIP